MPGGVPLTKLPTKTHKVLSDGDAGTASFLASLNLALYDATFYTCANAAANAKVAQLGVPSNSFLWETSRAEGADTWLIALTTWALTTTMKKRITVLYHGDARFETLNDLATANGREINLVQVQNVQEVKAALKGMLKQKVSPPSIKVQCTVQGCKRKRRMKPNGLEDHVKKMHPHQA